MQSKKEARLNKKKRKLEALATVTKLNENDKRKDSKMKTASTADDSSEKSICKTTQLDLGEPIAKRTKQHDDNNAKECNSDTEGSAHQSVLSDEDYAQLKRELNHKKRELKNVPKLRMKLFGDSALLTIPPSDRTPIFFTDIQHLIMYGLFGSSSPCVPGRWCHLERANKTSHTIVVLIDGLSLYHYSSYESQLDTMQRRFEHKLEVVMPGNKSTDQMISEIMMVPLANICREDFITKYGSLEAAIDSIKNPVFMVNSVFPVSDNNESESDSGDEDAEEDGGGAGKTTKKSSTTSNGDEVFSRTQLLLSALQMIDEGYPLPLRGELANRYKEFVMTKDRYKEVTAQSPMFALDCEMCRTSAGVNELTRISIINEQHESIYETLVCPRNKIIDYLTPFSGITPQMMKNVTKTLSEVQSDVRKILPADAILVGQSLHSDLMAMRMMHPYVIDTSVIFNISGDRRRKSKLQTLSAEFLGESIQKNPLGHDSIEDCSASLKLTKLKLQNGIDFGDAILANRRRANERNQSEKEETTSNTAAPAASSTTSTSNKMDRSTAVITSNETFGEAYEQIVLEKLGENAAQTDANKIHIFKNATNKSAVQKTGEIALNHALVLTHLSIDANKLADENAEKTMRKVDQWVSNIWESAAPNALVLVLFSGLNCSETAADSSTGVAMVQVKSKP